MASTAVIPIDIDTLRQKREAARLRKAVERRADIKAEMDALEAERKELNASIEYELITLGIDGVRVGALTCTRISMPGRETLDREQLRLALLERLKPSVVAEILEAATKRGSPYQEIRLTGRRG